MPSGATLLYFCPSAKGGIADYARYQSRALAALGVRVTVLTEEHWQQDPDEPYAILRLLGRSRAFASGPRPLRRIGTGLRYLRDFEILRDVIDKEKFDRVLLASFIEYLAPLWSWKFTGLIRNGVVFGAVAHDPVRNFVVGPRWWHEWSISCGYSFLSEVFVHENIELETFRRTHVPRTSVVPFGVYPFAAPSMTRSEARQKYRLPENASVLLAFGHIRDGKNLDLVLRAMKGFPEVHLIVAGKPQSAAQQPVEFYQSLAAELGLSDRCRWICDYIPESEVGNLFQASDSAVLCYSNDFRSGSSALNVAVHYRKPCLASSGEGSLKSTVLQYELGVWVEPDSVDALAGGIRQWLSAPPAPRWDDYEAQNSWQRNAEIVADRMRLLR